MYRELKDVSRLRAFEYKSFVYLNKEHRENWKHAARGVNTINLGFAHNTSAYVLYIQERKTFNASNQVKINEHEFPIWKKKMVEQYISDDSTHILFKSAMDVIWIIYNKLHVGNYSKVHHYKVSNVVVLQVNSQET
jgi:hypothetical protein